MVDLIDTLPEDWWVEHSGQSRVLDYTKVALAVGQLREALAWIHNSVEPDAIKHRSYDELAAAVDDVCVRALNYDFNENMHAAETYDLLRKRNAS